MRPVHELAETDQVLPAQRFLRLDDSLVFLHDVQAFLPCDLGNQPHAVSKVGRGIVSQRSPGLLHGEHLHARAAVLPAPSVLGIRQAMRNLGVCDENLHTFQGEGHVVVRQEPCVQQHRVALFGQARNELVHDSAFHPHELIFGLLGELREVFPADLDPVQVLDGQGRSHFQGGG